MQKQQSYIKDVLTIFRPSDMGDRYLNKKDFTFTGRDGVYIVEPKEQEPIYTTYTTNTSTKVPLNKN